MKKALDKNKKSVSGSTRYLIDESGGRVGVLVEIAEYERMKEAEEELEAIRAYDQAKASGEKPIPQNR